MVASLLRTVSVSFVLALMAHTAFANQMQNFCAAFTEARPTCRSHLLREPVFGGELSAVTLGKSNNPPLLIIHGLGSDGIHDWQTTARELAQTHYVILFDLPGFGQSASSAGKYSPANYAKIASTVLQRFTSAPADVIGHSMGGTIALHLASERPDLVKKLIVVSPAGVIYRSSFMKHVLTGRVPRANGAADFALVRLRQWGNSAAERLFDLPDLAKLLSKSDALWAKVFTQLTVANAGLALINDDVSAKLKNLRAETLIIWGEHDAIAPVRTGYALSKVIARSSLMILPNANHMPMNSPAEGAFIAVVRNALRTDSRIGTPQVLEAPPAELSDLKCSNETGKTYQGRYRYVELNNCHDVRLVHIQANRLTLRSSSADLTDATITTPEVALDLQHSTLFVTSATITANVVVQASASSLDFAGAQISAQQLGVLSHGSRWFCSLCQLSATPSYSLHGEILPKTAALALQPTTTVPPVAQVRIAPTL